MVRADDERLVYYAGKSHPAATSMPPNPNVAVGFFADDESPIKLRRKDQSCGYATPISRHFSKT